MKDEVFKVLSKVAESLWGSYLYKNSHNPDIAGEIEGWVRGDFESLGHSYDDYLEEKERRDMELRHRKLAEAHQNRILDDMDDPDNYTWDYVSSMRR